MINGIFLTGTSTGVGKSAAAAFIVATARAVGLAPLYWKPVQCGPGEWKGELEPDGDAATVRRLIGGRFPSFTSLSFASSSSPQRAARLEGGVVDLDSLLCDWGLLEEGALPEGVAGGKFDWIVAEGAGGLLVPLTDEVDMASLALETAGRLIVVSKPGLGAINSTRLTIEVARARGLDVVGFLFSPPQKGDDLDIVEDNWRAIERLEKLPFFGFVPRLERDGELFVEKQHALYRWLEEEKRRTTFSELV